MQHPEIMEHIKSCDQMAIYLGIEPLECSDGYGKASMPLDKRHLNGTGIAHGGAIFSLADVALALAALSHGNMAVTLNLNISYINPGKQGPLLAEAKEISASSRISHYEIIIRDAAGQIAAHCSGMAYHKKERFSPQCYALL